MLCYDHDDDLCINDDDGAVDIVNLIFYWVK